MVDGETIRASGTRVATVPDGLGDKGGGEGCEGRVKRVRLDQASLDTSGKGVRGVGGDRGKLFIKGRGYCKGTCVSSGVEGDGLIRGGRGTASG